MAAVKPDTSLNLSALIGLFKAARVNNLLILVLTQLCAYTFLRSEPLEASIDIELSLFVLATIMVAAGGYIINDYFDVKIDAINKPSNLVVGKTLPPRLAMIFHWILSGGSVVIAFFLDLKLGVLFIAISGLLWLYSSSLKRAFLIGNFAIALLMGLSVFAVYLFDAGLNFNWVVFYSVFAFYTGLIREILKDVEDMEGDRSFGCKTLPIVKGYPYTRKVLLGLTGFLGVLFIGSSIMFYQHDFRLLAFYFIVLCGLTIHYMVNLNHADTKKEYKYLSRYLKVIMLAGILSMILK